MAKLNNNVISAKGRKQHTVSTATSMLLMLAPFLILFIYCTLLPIVSSVVLSFFHYDVVSTPIFAGIENYSRMFAGDEIFPTAIKNTLLFAVITGPLSFLLALLLAWMLNEVNPRLRSFLSFLFYSPALVGNAYFVWQILFHGDSYGYVNSALISMNLISEPIQWFRTPTYAVVLVMVVQLWMSMGVSFLANIAGFQNCNAELFEAGAIDGVKNRWVELWYITLPQMKSILLFGCVMQIQSTFSISTVATALTGFPSVNYSTETIVTHLLDVGTYRYEMGYACAISVVLFAVVLLVRIFIGKLMDTLGR